MFSKKVFVIVSNLRFISRQNEVFSWAEHEKCFMNSGSGWLNGLLHMPQRQKTYLRTCALSDHSDKPAHLSHLIRILTRRIVDSQWGKLSSYGQQKLWSACVEAQADLSLRWANMSEGTFSHVSAYIINVRNILPLRFLVSNSTKER